MPPRASVWPALGLGFVAWIAGSSPAWADEPAAPPPAPTVPPAPSAASGDAAEGSLGGSLLFAPGRSLPAAVARPGEPRPIPPAPVASPSFDHPPIVAPKLDDPQPPLRLFYRNLFAARYNPLGLINDFRLSGRAQLYEPDNPITAENFVGLGTSFSVTPAWVRAGPFVEIQPLSILTFAAGVEATGYYGSFNQVQGFADANSPYDDASLKANASPADGSRGSHYPTYGRVGWLEGRFQFKLFNLALRNAARAQYTDLVLRDGQTVFYDQIVDALAQNGGWTVTNDFDGLWFFDDNWILGFRWSLTHSFLADPAGGRDAPPQPGDEPFARKLEMNRIGPVLAYRFWDRPWSNFNQPTINLLAQWWVDHPYRTGDGACGESTACSEKIGKFLDASRSSQGVPVIALAFSFNGDLLGKPKTKRP
jgi:hypothetical protein